MNRLDALVDFYETLTIDELDRLDTLYAPNAHFKDPFNDVCGVPAIAGVFRHMFETLDAPRFVVLGRFGAAEEAMIRWRFSFATRGRGRREMRFVGSSHLQFGEDGKVISHRDYWDPAEALYEHLPLIGFVMRCLRRRLRAPR